ncbi:MAG: hypothetical protein JST12_14545 [Armatimonadetes bacterium]|nr:hypothetical protein [Armatimonadota bacterium]
MASTSATNLIKSVPEARLVASQLSKASAENWQDKQLAALEAIPVSERTVNNLRAMWRIYCHEGQTEKAEATREEIEALGCTPRGDFNGSRTRANYLGEGR